MLLMCVTRYNKTLLFTPIMLYKSIIGNAKVKGYSTEYSATAADKKKCKGQNKVGWEMENVPLSL